VNLKKRGPKTGWLFLAIPLGALLLVAILTWKMESLVPTSVFDGISKAIGWHARAGGEGRNVIVAKNEMKLIGHAITYTYRFDEKSGLAQQFAL
jgi:hypothetical protein